MAPIRILSEILSNQIAAGEVVQRPASVVKELVENSIDACATRITIEIEHGGKSIIRISDDGCGLTRDEALLSVERYATSKIFSQEDLFSIATFGFRGEALPSIASVSKFCLVSRTPAQDSGAKIEILGGKLVRVSDTGAPAGTLVEVGRLFFNTPARRKFLKGEATEAGHIADGVSGLALGNPGVGFDLYVDKKLVRHFPPGQDLFQRAQLVLGKEAADKLYPLELADASISVTGVCSNPLVTRSTAGRIYLFVNKRQVADRGLVAAFFRGYEGKVMKGRFPMGVICVGVPFDQVDVNVHPSKREIKFLNPGPVYQAVFRAVAKALSSAMSDRTGYAKVARNGQPVAQAVSLPEPGHVSPGKDSLETGKAYVYSREKTSDLGKVSQSLWDWDFSSRVRPPKREPDEGICIQESSQTLEKEDTVRQTSPGSQNRPKVLGQVMNTYIVVEQERSLVLIDQHAAHERVVYETLKKRHQTLTVQSQNLLVPEVLELTLGEADLLTGILEELAGLGLKIEPFGGSDFVIKAIPSLLEAKELKPLVLEIIDTLREEKVVTESQLDGCLISMACHRAVRAKKQMHMQEMVQLVEDLESCDNPLHCPHGRPTMISFDSVQLQKLFKRIV